MADKTPIYEYLSDLERLARLPKDVRGRIEERERVRRFVNPHAERPSTDVPVELQASPKLYAAAQQQLQWEHILWHQREMAYLKIGKYSDAEIRDGGPTGIKAHLIFARLIGFDGEIVRDEQLDRYQDDILVPIMQSMTVNLYDPFSDEALSPSEATIEMRTAKFVCQNVFYQLGVAWHLLPYDLLPPNKDYTATLLFLLYKRRS